MLRKNRPLFYLPLRPKSSTVKRIFMLPSFYMTASFTHISNLIQASFIEVTGFVLIGITLSAIFAPILIKTLYKYRITRRDHVDSIGGMEHRNAKINTPVMGGLLVVFSVLVTTLVFNWDRKFTWVPIGVMILSAGLGGVDDLLNIFGPERRNRPLKQVITLAKVHKQKWMRLWYLILIPWTYFKKIIGIFGSKQNRGVQAHEKLLLQFAAGGITAWWIYFKLGETWQDIYIPYYGFLTIGAWIIPLIIAVVIFTANAVNISDGMDGLAGGMLIPTFGALGFLSWALGYQSLALLNATTVGSLLVYTYFNIKPARFQMGDVGSLALGALLAINALAINSMAILIFTAFMFYAEAFSVIIQVIGRTLFGRRIFKMAPLHHHFELKGWSEEKTIMRFWVIHLCFVILGVWIGLH